MCLNLDTWSMAGRVPSVDASMAQGWPALDNTSRASFARSRNVAVIGDVEDRPVALEVTIVDGHRLTSDGIRFAIDRSPELEVVPRSCLPRSCFSR